jgi:hypothetical protein
MQTFIADAGDFVGGLFFSALILWVVVIQCDIPGVTVWKNLCLTVRHTWRHSVEIPESWESVGIVGKRTVEVFLDFHDAFSRESFHDAVYGLAAEPGLARDGVLIWVRVIPVLICVVGYYNQDELFMRCQVERFTVFPYPRHRL